MPNPYVLIGLAIAAAVLFLYVRYLQISRDHWKNQATQIQATLDSERASHKKAMEDADEQRKTDFAAAVERNKIAVDHLQERLDFHTANANALAERLRVAERSRLRPLAPSAAAPADCGNYESDPTRLSEQARGFLIGEAAAAEENGDLLEACRADYATVKITCGIK